MNVAKVAPTQEQIDLLEFLIQFTEQNGYQPSRQEMADHFGITFSAIQGRLASLEKRGFILAGSESRAIKIAGVVFSAEFSDGKFTQNFKNFQERADHQERLDRLDRLGE